MDPIQTSPAVSVPPPVSELSPAPKPKSRLNSRLLLVIATLTGLLLASFAVVYVLQAQKNNSTPTPITQPSPSPTPDPTANWKTFSFDGITFKYPSDWRNPDIINSETGKVAQIKKNQNEIESIDVVSGISKGASPQEQSDFLKELVKGGAQKLILDGSEATKNKLTDKNGTIITAYIVSRDKTFLYSISIQSNSTQGKELEKLFDQILSTFKFTDQSTDASDWKEYTNFTYRFSFKYPAEQFPYVHEQNNVNNQLYSIFLCDEETQRPAYCLAVDVSTTSGTLSDLASRSLKLENQIQSATKLDSTNALQVKGTYPSSPTQYRNQTYLITPQYGYTISYFNYDQNLFQKFQPTYNQILSTFKFTQ